MMNRYIIFSFDDGRKDQYDVAYRILKEYDFPATINIVSEFINDEKKFSVFKTMGNKSLSWENLKEMENDGGWEIACHGAWHKNDVEDIRTWMNDDHIINNKWQENVGFASPTSYINEKNCFNLLKAIDNKKMLYVRSGKRVREMGWLYILKSIVNRYLKSEKLFVNLHQDCIIHGNSFGHILLSVPITSYDTVEEVCSLIKNVQIGDALILMFHSIIDNNDVRNAKDKWYWESLKLKQLCAFIKEDSSIQVITTKKWVEQIMKERTR